MRNNSKGLMRKSRIYTAMVLCFVIAMVLTGCAAVQPWEREYLADPIMQQEESAEGAYEQHLHRALSQGLAGEPVAGGGCGCEQ